jgi:hypothetical protein
MEDTAMKHQTVSAFSIARNEEDLIAKHLIHLQSIADEVICVVQPSKDATLLIAREVARQSLGSPIFVIEHAPEKFGWEFSLAHAANSCTSAWVFALCVDETYVGEPLHLLVESARQQKAPAIWIPRLHAVAKNTEEWFKAETYLPQARLVKKSILDPKYAYDLHNGWNQMLAKGCWIRIPEDRARIIELKSPSRHYMGQLFTHARGVMNERAKCEKEMNRADLKLGKVKRKLYWR